MRPRMRPIDKQLASVAYQKRIIQHRLIEPVQCMQPWTVELVVAVEEEVCKYELIKLLFSPRFLCVFLSSPQHVLFVVMQRNINKQTFSESLRLFRLFLRSNVHCVLLLCFHLFTPFYPLFLIGSWRLPPDETLQVSDPKEKLDVSNINLFFFIPFVSTTGKFYPNTKKKIINFIFHFNLGLGLWRLTKLEKYYIRIISN